MRKVCLIEQGKAREKVLLKSNTTISIRRKINLNLLQEKLEDCILIRWKITFK